ncbi:fluoride efflux transporter CrcB [Candidatus Methylomicrobium oryzae]|jgi:CrcB protein|uniref:fluoride efflux transporter CrcB n=1 Tax=Candidatus Methylomicrobium oryzae TaxID=2802053 RepID=UPI001923FF98|nr:fluoride efflux transporter CrcB [Methylomicrobium sp. RS1]MBL1264210.1 fluoride efflux transporter CrcB [Methylomicrobium sp. RS1]
MNQLIVIAFGGAFGSVARFLVSSGVYQWLGRGFPYGTLAVNVIGSFLIGLLAEALILQRVTFALEYRAAILVGFLGGFTTFSSFSLETLYLIEQGAISKAAANIALSVAACLLAVWIGLLAGRSLYYYSAGMIHWQNHAFPYAIMTVNALIAFLIGIVSALLLQHVEITAEYRAAIMVVMAGAFLTLSGLYVVLYLLEHGYTLETQFYPILGVFAGNGLFCLFLLWLGLMAGERI